MMTSFLVIDSSSETRLPRATSSAWPLPDSLARQDVAIDSLGHLADFRHDLIADGC